MLWLWSLFYLGWQWSLMYSQATPITVLGLCRQSTEARSKEKAGRKEVKGTPGCSLFFCKKKKKSKLWHLRLDFTKIWGTWVGVHWKIISLKDKDAKYRGSEPEVGWGTKALATAARGQPPGIRGPASGIRGPASWYLRARGATAYAEREQPLCLSPNANSLPALA